MDVFLIVWFGIISAILTLIIAHVGTAKIYDRYGESKALVFIIVFVLIVGIAALAISCVGVEINQLTCDYYATLDVPSMNLQENYVYHVKFGEFHGLYRRWKIPLTIEWHENVKPNVTLLGVESSYPYYVRDYLGRVFVWYGGPAEEKLVRKHAKPNEVGIVSSGGFSPGDYRVRYVFRIYSPIHTDGKFDHFNIKLADEHVPYDKVRILVRDPKHLIVKLIPHFEGCRVEKTEDGYVITGSSPENGLIEIEAILKHDKLTGYYVRVDDVMKRTLEANRMEMGFSKDIVEKAILGIVLIYPAIVLFIYRRFGTEKEFTVPEFLSYVPKKRKPWFVNLVFSKDVEEFDLNGLMATIMDLSMRGFLEIKSEGKNLIVRVLRTGGNLDEYERKVVMFFEKYSENGVFDIKRIRDRVRKNREWKIAREWQSLLRPPKTNIAKDFVDTTGRKILIRLFLASIIVVIVFGWISPIPSLAFFLQSLACVVAPSQLFGRWRGDHYKEKLEWVAFRRFLSDMAMIKKYAPEDISIWKDWLVYGTALGVGENVSKAMKDLNIRLPETDVYVYGGGLHSLHSFAKTTSSSSGGGFGSGGGSGGGGAGGW